VRPELDTYVDAIVAGDPDAFGHWVAGAEPSLRASLRPFATHLDIEAVLQESLLRLWQVAPRFHPDGGQNGFFRFAVRIAHNLAISESRRARVTPSDLESIERALADASDELGDVPDPLLRQLIEECREKLPSKPAAALSARLEASGGDADAILAERLGMRTNTFLQNFTRARKLLADCLKKRGYDLSQELP
jgi:RNA polymerase sigma factor (sigma-70 family)